MIKKLLLSFVSLLCCINLFGQEGLEVTKPLFDFQLKENFADNFSKDNRSSYEIDGDVSWQDGQLKFAEGASIQREIVGGPWIRLRANLDAPLPTETVSESELQIWLDLAGVTDCFVSLSISLDGETPRAVCALYDTAEEDGELFGYLVHEEQVSVEQLCDIVIEYRCGLVNISSHKESLLVAHIENGAAECNRLYLESSQQSWAINDIAVESAGSIQAPLNGEKLSELEKVWELEDQLEELIDRGEFESAKQIASTIQSTRRRLNGSHHPDYATSLYESAMLYDATGNTERAEELYRQTGEIESRVIGEDHPDYALTLFKLAEICKSKGDLTQAQDLFEQVQKVDKRILGEDHPDYAITLSSLAELFMAQGNHEQAEKLLVETATRFRPILGEDSLEYADLLFTLADAYASNEKLVQAEQLYQKVLDTQTRQLDPLDSDRAFTLNHFAAVSRRLGKFDAAEQQYVAAAKIFAATLGREHPEYARNLSALAQLKIQTGQFTEAEPLLQEARNVLSQSLGESHPNYAEAIVAVATFYQLTGDFPRAESLWIESREIYASVYGTSHPEYLTSQSNLALLYWKMKDYDLAEPLFLEALEGFRSVSGEDHSSYAVVLNNLAALYTEQSDFAKAKQLLEDAVETAKRTLGEDNSNYTNMIHNLAWINSCLGDYEQAEKLHREAMSIRVRNYGEENIDVLKSLNGLGWLYFQSKEYATAAHFFERAFRLRLSATERVLPSLSQSQAMEWAKEYGPYPDLLFSAFRLQPSLAESSPYEFVWKSKLATTRLRVSASIAASSSAEAKQVAVELRDTQRELARLISGPAPASDQASFLTNRIALVSEQKEALEKQLASLNPATKRELSVRDSTVEQLKAILPPRTAIVDLLLAAKWEPTDFADLDEKDPNIVRRAKLRAVATRSYHAFVISNGQATDIPWIDLGDAAPIEIAINQWRAKLTAPNAIRGLGTKSRRVEPNEIDPSAVLRELIWDKLEPCLEEIDTVIIIPDGDLNRLPWAALPGRNEGTYLIHDYAITTASYGQQLY